MRLIVITSEAFLHGEENAINLLFENGLDTLHLRKPAASEAETALFIEKIKEKYHRQMVLHDHFSIMEKFALKGIHLNRRNKVVPEGFLGTKSISCHSISELSSNTEMDYLFLSPIFNSISKDNYPSGFSEETLFEAKKSGVINEKVMALGGITKDNIAKTKYYGFGGAVVLGALWEEFTDNHDADALLNRFKELQYAINQ